MTKSPDIDARLALAETLARKAGAHASKLHESGALNVSTKHDALDLVSRADRENEALIRAGIAADFPDDAILGEEEGATDGDSGVTWVIDPIDGTVPFVAGLGHWCVVIALTEGDETRAGVIYHPQTDEMFTTRQGQGVRLNGELIRVSSDTVITNSLTAIGASHRTSPDHVSKLIGDLMRAEGMFYRNGSGALMLAAVAAGRLGAYYEPHMHPWDCLAGLLMVKEAGGRIRPFTPQDIKTGGAVIASAPGSWQVLNALIDGAS